MVTINNQEMKKAFSNSTKTQLSEQPNQVDNRNVIPIIDITPVKHKVIEIIKAGGSSVTGTTTIYTTPTKGDFYLTGYSVCWETNAACDSTAVQLTGVVNSEVVYIFNHRKISLSAQSGAITQEFLYPIKLDKGSNISLLGTFAAGTLAKSASIHGYVEDSQ